MKKIFYLFIYFLSIVFVYADNLTGIIDKYVRFDDWADAKKELETYLASNPADVEANAVYAEVLNSLKLYDEAIIAVRQAINYEKSDDKKGELYYNLGLYYYNKDLSELALQTFDKALKFNHTIDVAYYLAGRIYYDKKDYENFLAQWKKYVNITANTDKKIKVQKIIDLFEKKLLEEKLRKEAEQKAKDELMKKLMDDLQQENPDSKSLEADKNKTKKSDVYFEELE